ncbi:C2H2-type zinc finger protein, partial [Teratosphaeria destructans]
MAAIQRATTPGAEPFPSLETPRTPTSLASGAIASNKNAGLANSNLLQPQPPQKSIADISPRSDKRAYSPRTTPVPLTGVAAMAELKKRKQQKAAEDASNRQTSPNPAVAAMQSLMGNGGMSKPSDAPAPDKLSEPMRKAAEKINIPDNAVTS